MSKKAIYPGIRIIDELSVDATFGNGLIGTAAVGKKVLLVDLLKPAKVGHDYDAKNISGVNIVLNFDNEKGLDVLMDAMKVVKKEFRKRKRK